MEQRGKSLETTQESGKDITGITLECRKSRMPFNLVVVFDFNAFE